MKLRFASLSLLALGLLATVPAAAQSSYSFSNGPTNGNLYAWTVNFGFIVSDSFNVYAPLGETQITGASFSMWLFPGDTMSSAELSITSSENGGTSYFDQTVSFSQSGCVGNQFGYNVCTETTNLYGYYTYLTNGTYWVNLQNAQVTNGDPVYWDENFGGPSSYALGQSLASENSVGTIPSESFTIVGIHGFAPGGTTTTGTVPEPSSIMLIGSGILGLAGMLRRKLF